LIQEQTRSPAIQQKKKPHQKTVFPTIILEKNAREIDPLRRTNRRRRPIRDIFVGEVERIVVKQRQKVDKYYAETRERDLDHD